MKFAQLITVSVLLATTTLSLLDDANKGCITNSGKECTICFRSKPLAPKQGCGAQMPENDSCAMYDYLPKVNKVTCGLCKAGYTLQTTRTGEGVCNAGTIEGCVYEMQYGPQHVCIACKDNKYGVLDQKTKKFACLPASSKGKKPIENCEWGATFQIAGFRCFKCLPGYVVSADAQSCLKQDDKTTGCWQLNRDGKRCLACDTYDGFSQQDDFTCLKDNGERME